MDFCSPYRHGFLRVAACTVRTAIADPRANAASVLRVARECHDDGVALAVFPELTLSGYSIEDLLMQDTLLDAVETALLDVVAGSADLLPVLVVGAPLRYRHRIYNCAGVVHAGGCSGSRRSRTCRPTGSSTSGGRSHRATTGGRRSRWRVEVPFGPDLLFAADDVPGFVLHVEICEDMWVPVPPSAEAALAGATVLANLSGSPITVGRAEDRRLLVRSASSRCLAAYAVRRGGRGRVDHRPRLGRPDDDLRERRAARRDRAVPEGERRSVADVDLDLLRPERLRRARSTTTAVIMRRAPGRVPQVAFRFDPPAGDIGSAAPGRALPVRARGRPDAAGPGLLRGLQHPGRRPRAAAAGDRRTQDRDRRLRAAWTRPTR